MRKYIALLALSMLIVKFATAQETNWVSLVGNNDLSNWVIKKNPKDNNREFWKLKDGVISGNSMGSKDHDYVWLMTKEEYKNFELKLKFKCSKILTGNSGIQIRSRYDNDSFWMDGPQIDINPPEPWRSGMMWEETREAKRWIYPDLPKEKWVNKEMREELAPFYYMEDSEKWNEMHIIVKGYKITAFLNEIQVTDFNNKKILADEPHKKYNTGTKGHIALQIHKNDEVEIYFKDIYIKE